jgi:hypothetical protein
MLVYKWVLQLYMRTRIHWKTSTITSERKNTRIWTFFLHSFFLIIPHTFNFSFPHHFYHHNTTHNFIAADNIEAIRRRRRRAHFCVEMLLSEFYLYQCMYARSDSISQNDYVGIVKKMYVWIEEREEKKKTNLKTEKKKNLISDAVQRSLSVRNTFFLW